MRKAASTRAASGSTGGHDEQPKVPRQRTDCERLPPRPRVLHVVEYLHAGVATALQQYIEATPDLEHRVLCRRARLTPGARDAAEFGGLHVDCRPGGLLSFARSYQRVLCSWRPTHVHAHSSRAGFLTRLLPTHNARIVYSPHCYSTEREDVSGAVRAAFVALELFAGLRRHTVAALSEHEAAIARRLAPRGRVVRVPNRAPDRQGRSNSAVPSQRPRIVTLGRICAQKDPSFFSAVIRELSTALSVSVLWIGDGEPLLRAELESSGVEVSGWTAAEDAQQLLASADLYLHTAAWEGSPMALLEAVAAGVPVAVREIASLRALGYPSGGSTPEQVAALVAAALTRSDVRRELMQAGRRVLEAHGLPQQRRGLLSCYGHPDGAPASAAPVPAVPASTSPAALPTSAMVG